MLAGRYVACARIGRGATASVYVVFDRRLKVWRAAKVLHGDLLRDREQRERFAREAWVMARLEHPNVVRIVDVALDVEPPFLVMEFVDGGSISRWSKAHGPMPAALAVRATLDLCRGLSALHAVGGVHRDVKPQNVLLDRSGRARLTDFGIARVGASTDPEHALTAVGTVMGTVAYMAPEQRLDSSTVDHRADVYGAGATLFSLLCGGAVMDPSLLEPEDPRLSPLPLALRAVVLRACEYRPEERYQTIDELARHLELVPLPPPPPGTPPLVDELPPMPLRPPERFSFEEAERLGDLYTALERRAHSESPETLRPRAMRPVLADRPIPERASHGIRASAQGAPRPQLESPVQVPVLRMFLAAVVSAGSSLAVMMTLASALAVYGARQVSGAERDAAGEGERLVAVLEVHRPALAELDGAGQPLDALARAADHDRVARADDVAEVISASDRLPDQVREAVEARRAAREGWQRSASSLPGRVAIWLHLAEAP